MAWYPKKWYGISNFGSTSSGQPVRGWFAERRGGSRRGRRRLRPESDPILREWSAKNTTVALFSLSPISISPRIRLKSVNFAPAAGRLTKFCSAPSIFDFWRQVWRRAQQVVFLPPKSGIYHMSIPQPPVRSVPQDPHTGKSPALSAERAFITKPGA